MNAPSILVAGIGNIFLGDDAFGVEVVKRLSQLKWPENVRVIDFGIRGFELACALDGYDVSILIDATQRGGAPGTLYLIEPDKLALNQLDAQELSLDLHTLDPVKVLSISRSLGCQLKRILLVGCEPERLHCTAEGEIGLSAPVAASLGAAIDMVDELIKKLIAESIGKFSN